MTTPINSDFDDSPIVEVYQSNPHILLWSEDGIRYLMKILIYTKKKVHDLIIAESPDPLRIRQLLREVMFRSQYRNKSEFIYSSPSVTTMNQCWMSSGYLYETTQRHDLIRELVTQESKSIHHIFKSIPFSDPMHL